MSTFTLSSKIGKFTFEEGTSISLAKIIRDSVMGQLLAPKPREDRVTDASSAYEFMRRADGELLRHTIFTLVLDEGVKKLKIEPTTFGY